MVYTEEYHIRKRKGNTYLLMPDPVSYCKPLSQQSRYLSRPLPVAYKSHKTPSSPLSKYLFVDQSYRL